MSENLLPQLLHPKLRELLARPNEVTAHATLAEARRAFDAELAAGGRPGPSMSAIIEHSVGLEHAHITVRLYRPSTLRPAALAPCLVFFHGGGWMFGGLESHDSLAKMLAHHGQCVVAAVDYRLAPEHPFPGPVEDCHRATTWLIEAASGLGLDARRFALGGDSAGGNLALAVIQRLAPRLRGAIRYMALLYPATDLGADTESKRRFSKGYWLDSLEKQVRTYLGSVDNAANPLASPLRASDMSDWPPARIVAAGFDPLRDEAELLAQALIRSGIAAEFICYPQYVHGFLSLGGLLPEVEDITIETALALRRGLSTP
jgi:acetyl esterase